MMNDSREAEPGQTPFEGEPSSRVFTKKDRAFATWCVMSHARPVLVEALRAWGVRDAAKALEDTTSPGGLRHVAHEAYEQVRRRIFFFPAQRELFHALFTLQVAATFAGRGDGENASATAIGVFTGSAGALAWRRPWQRWGWKQRRTMIIDHALREQEAYRATLK